MVNAAHSRPYTMIIHPNTLQQMEQALAGFCTFTVTTDDEGAKTYTVIEKLKAELTFNESIGLDVLASARFIPMKHLPLATEPLVADPARSPVKPASHQNMQELRKFLRMDRRVRT